MATVIHLFFTLISLVVSLFHPSSILNPTDDSSPIPTVPPFPTIIVHPTLPPPTPRVHVYVITPMLSPRPTPKPTVHQLVRQPADDTGPWGVARQLDEHTWTMKLGQDPIMATPTDILTALNAYRVRRGSQPLTLDPKLAAYAQSRADYLASIKNTDDHRGFNDYLTNQNGFDELGFTWLGENISYGYRLAGVHLIEWLYAGDKEHDDNQVANRWNYVGIGVKGTATSLIFGTGKR